MPKRPARAAEPDRIGGYLRLVRRFPLRPIRSEEELDRAIATADSLLDRKDLDPGERDYLDVLGDLIHRYESQHDPLRPVPDAEMLAFLLESNAMAQAELAQQSGVAASTISEILAGKRRLSRRHISALARVFRVSPAVFFPEVDEMTIERAAETLGRRSGIKLTPELLDSLASAFAMDPDRGAWRAFRDLVDGEKPGMSNRELAARLNAWGEGGDCWRPEAFHITGNELRALATALAAERECWRAFRDLVEATLPDIRSIQREIAEEN